MQQMIPVLAAMASLAVPQTSAAAGAPATVGTCAVHDRVAYTDGPIRTTSAGRATAIASPRRDRAFHPDYSHALSAEQMSRAWTEEIERLSPPVVTGGG